MAEYTYGKDFAIRTEIDCIATEDDFGQYVGRITAVKIKTNADRIRSMSDEELAEHVLVIKATKDYCSGDCNCLVQKDKTCYKCRLEWLRKEADE